MGDELLITEARSTILSGKGRCVTSARTNHLVIDEPVHNGGPGEAFTPGETFLSSVLACGSSFQWPISANGQPGAPPGVGR